MSLWVNIAGPERGLVGVVLAVVVWVRLWQGLSSISARGGVEGLVGLGDVVLVESGCGHGLLGVVYFVACEDVSALFGEGLLEVRVGGDDGSISLVLGDDHVFPLNRMALFAHVVVGGSVHVTGRPLEEALFGDGGGLAVTGLVELVLRRS